MFVGWEKLLVNVGDIFRSCETLPDLETTSEICFISGNSLKLVILRTHRKHSRGKTQFLLRGWACLLYASLDTQMAPVFSGSETL